MKYYWKVFKYEKGQKAEEYTQYLIMPIFMEPRLDETLGTGEIILDGMPTNTRQAFPPKTKFRIERYLTKDFSDSPKMYDFVVDSDNIEEYVGVPKICCHRINLIEPSVIAQGMHCDNFSLTRELRDVDLSYKTVVSSTKKVSLIKHEVIGSGYDRPNLEYGKTSRSGTGWFDNLKTAEYKLINSFKYIWRNTEAIGALIENLNGLEENSISFTIPTCVCQWQNNTVSEDLFECPVRTSVTRTTFKNNQPVLGSEVEIANHFYSPSSVQFRNDHVMWNTRSKVGFTLVVGEKYKGDSGSGSTQAMAVFFPESRLSKFPAMINLEDVSHTNKNFSFTTDSISQTEISEGKSFKYIISSQIEPFESGAILQEFTAYSSLAYHWFTGADYFVTTMRRRPDPSQILVNTNLFAKDMTVASQPIPYLIKPNKYSCFDLIRKAFLTCDTQVFDNTAQGLDELYSAEGDYVDLGIQYPIVIDSGWITKLKETQMNETVFEGKNLWEVLLQVGYYLHAIPYLTFASNGSDKFVLQFRQLGGNILNRSKSTKITVFNSQNLSEYFTQLDSYVTNIFSPQNEIEEWIVPKTSDNSFLVSNETAELQTKYNISEIVEFDIEFDGRTLSALDYIFEKTVYNVLTAKTGVYPGKWAAIYYTLGGNKIEGLNYVPPSVSSGEQLMALKKICYDLFNSTEKPLNAENLVFNQLKFYIKYKTQDTLRISQFKPTLTQFMKNSEFERYPHHEQFFGQQDKIVDSERFSANLWGRLVRIANAIYQCNEYAATGEEKEVGELVEINTELYYVTSVENEYYNDIVLQKVTYSKNFNQISQVVTIPSEPRFYEVSERSMIRREVRLMEFLLLTSTRIENILKPRFINGAQWRNLVKKMFFADGGQPILPNFAYTKFKADIYRQHIKNSNEVVALSDLYPNSETVTIDGAVTPLPSRSYKAVIVPLLHFSLKNAIVFEWDMADNFKAGDAIDTSISGNVGITDKSYYSLFPVRYCDVMGRADLFSFKLFNKDDWTTSQIQRLPFAENTDFIPTDEQSLFLMADNLSIGLDKDNREALSFNYQINLLTENNSFITYPNLFGKKQARLKMCFLKEPTSMFDSVVNFSTDNVVADNIEYMLLEDTENALEVRIPVQEIDVGQVGAIVLYEQDGGSRYAYIARNVDKLKDGEKLNSWWIHSVFNA